MIEREARVSEIIKRTYNVKSFRLDVENKWVDFKAGQFMQVALKDNPAESKYLSISSSPTEKCHIEFTKKITNSDFSKNLDSLRPGDPVLIKYPFGNFTLRQGAQKIAFLSGGIGITPIRSIAKFAVDTKLGADLILVYANGSIRDVAFKDDFDFMQKEYPKLKVAHVLCEPAPGFKCSVGLVNSQVIKNEVPDYAKRLFYLCGPPGMVGAMKNILTEGLGILEENIVIENFQGY